VSYFEDQEDCWLANNCKGRLEDYDPYDADNWPGSHRSLTPNKEELAFLANLVAATSGKGLKCACCGNGHFQIRAGRKVINWYPNSKKQTAYDNFTGEKRFHLTMEQVIAFALEPATEAT
jgi:hypothetical protein